MRILKKVIGNLLYSKFNEDEAQNLTSLEKGCSKEGASFYLTTYCTHLAKFSLP